MSTQQMLTPRQRMNTISQQGLCAGCGICQSVAGVDKIKVMKTTTGFERPVVVGELDDATVDKIYDICPGTRIEGLPESEIRPQTKIDNVWGAWQRMVLGWAGNAEVRHRASTGGVLTALAQFLLEDNRVDFILHAKASTIEPSFGEPHLSFNSAQVLEGTGSRYGPTAPLLHIDDVLARNQSFAFIGKPCDIAALRNYAHYDVRVNQLVKYYLTPVCGGFMQPATMNEFLRGYDIQPEQVKSLRYRGYGCPGSTRIETASEVKEMHYLDFWGEDESSWHLPFRCKICPDGIGESADIVASDTWVGGSPNRTDSETDLGTNGIVVRSACGMELLHAAVKAGVIELGRELHPDDMSIYQPHQMRKKYAVQARYQGLAEAGRIVPTTERLRLIALSEELPAAVNDIQRSGTIQRIQSGKATEPEPEVFVLM